MAKKSAKILIVEDEPFLLELYQTKLVQEGYNALVASNGDVGFAQALNNLPDLILLDLLMPKVDGYEMLKKLKADSKTKAIPVIIFSNLTQKEEIEKGLRLGANDFIIKTSITPTQLASRVKGFLQNKK